MVTPRRSARTSTASAATGTGTPQKLQSPRDKRHEALIAARVADQSEDEAEGQIEAEAEGSGSEEGERERGAGSDEDSEDDSDSDSGSDSDSDDSASDSEDSESEPEPESDDEEELERQLAAARAAAAAAEKPASAQKSIFAGALGEDEDGEMRFDADAPKEAPIPDLAVGSLPKQVLSFAPDGTARAGAVAPADASAKEVKKEGAPELDRGAYQRSLSKREKKAQPKKASPSELWATIPAARSDDLPQMKRDYQALALSNTLDPKRFMKGGNRAGKVPERFQIGTMVDAPRHLQDTTVRKERKYRAGEIVKSIIADEQIGSYAKRKFEDLQGKRMYNGRGKGWQKRTKW